MILVFVLPSLLLTRWLEFASKALSRDSLLLPNFPGSPAYNKQAGKGFVRGGGDGKPLEKKDRREK
jgi:hypothetical protein